MLVDYALSWLGTPYIWGGDDFAGFDCSGLVQEILSSVGMDPPGDQTADSLMHMFTNRIAAPQPGALAFYGTPNATHVAFCIDNFRVVEAGGGGSKTLTVADASRQNAFVRIRPFDQRKDLNCIVMPPYRRLQ